MKPNRYAARCRDCGQWVEAEAGVVMREQQGDGSWQSSVTHQGACPATEVRVEPLPPVEQVASSTAVGRQWLAYWWHRGIRHRPPDVTLEQVDEWLEGADLEAMDRSVARETALLLAGESVHDPEAVRARLVDSA